MKKVVWLQIYKGSKVLYNENGKVENENQNVKLIYETLEWTNFLKAIRYNPYCKVEVIKVLQPTKDENNKIEYKEIEISESIKKEVLIAHKGDVEVKLTPEQKEIAELKAQMAILLGKNTKKETKVEDIKVVDEVLVSEDDNLSVLQEKHLDKFKKEVPTRYKNDVEWIKNKLNQ